MKFFEKELSWLAFNERVLQEAADDHVPVIERIRFLGIFSSNMDEFFQVRVADVRRRIHFEKLAEDRDHASALLTQIQQKVITLQEQFDRIQVQVMAALAKKNIYVIEEGQVKPNQQKWLLQYFHDKIKRHIVPLLITDRTNLVEVLKEDHIYFCVQLEQNGTTHYAAVEVPTDELSRFILLPYHGSKRRKDVILLDNIILMFLSELFRSIIAFDKIRAFSFKMTRDADYRLTYDIEQSVLERMEEGLKQRVKADPVRLVFDKAMPGAMLRFLCDKLDMDAYDSLVGGGRYRNTRDFAKFPNIGRKSLENELLPPIEHASFAKFDNIFDAIAERDILLYYPYHKFAHVSELVRQAAYDPAVKTIHICIYRVARYSRLIHSLMDAVHNGKQVVVMVELQARFDEEANIEWAKDMTDAGIRVIFGIQGIKVHSKLLLVHRTEGQLVRRYAYIGTGNFHEQTAQVYTDFGLMTCAPTICQEVEQVFQYLDQPYRRYEFRELIVSPLNTRDRLVSLIEDEIKAVQEGGKGEIFLKLNNLVDEAIIVQLYRASRAGVKIRAIVRGMCALRPGVSGLSETIQVRSIVDRFLEHPRVYVFHNQGKPKVFISSADIMTRNIDHRVEATCPIHDDAAKQMILDILELQWKDNQKARIIDSEQINRYVKRGNRKKLRSQVEIYKYLQAEQKAK